MSKKLTSILIAIILLLVGLVDSKVYLLKEDSITGINHANFTPLLTFHLLYWVIEVM